MARPLVGSYVRFRDGKIVPIRQTMSAKSKLKQLGEIGAKEWAADAMVRWGPDWLETYWALLVELDGRLEWVDIGTVEVLDGFKIP